MIHTPLSTYAPDGMKSEHLLTDRIGKRRSVIHQQLRTLQIDPLYPLFQTDLTAADPIGMYDRNPHIIRIRLPDLQAEAGFICTYSQLDILRYCIVYCSGIASDFTSDAVDVVPFCSGKQMSHFA